MKAPGNPELPSPSDKLTGWKLALVCISLIAAVAIVFGNSCRFPFTNYDDTQYVVANPEVRSGLTVDGIRWAFTSFYASNWHPLTWLSHMLDCQLYGLEPAGHHLTNLLLHAASVVLLFLFLQRITGAGGRSAAVALLWAIHPLRVESVVWIAERKDLLSGLFFLLTLLAYLRHVRNSSQAGGLWSALRSPAYWAVIACFALGLMSKPMLVTLPFVLLLLDYWPLARMQNLPVRQSGFLVLEKLPLILMSAASCVSTVLAQTHATVAIGKLSIGLRLANVAVAYVTYLRQTFWPANLAIHYPHPWKFISMTSVAIAVLLLCIISALVFFRRSKSPYALIGWLWFLGTLVPVIGLMQVGAQAHADRYTYLPQIGLLVALVWSIADYWRSRGGSSLVLSTSCAAVAMALMIAAWQQSQLWRSSESLWESALVRTQRNDRVHYNLGQAYGEAGKKDLAETQYRQALELNPDYVTALGNLGVILTERGKFEEACALYRRALQIDPEDSGVHSKLGVALLGLGRSEAALESFQRAIRYDPSNMDALNNIAAVFMTRGRIDEGIAYLERALVARPRDEIARENLEVAKRMKADLAREARPDAGSALEPRASALSENGPASMQMMNNLAWALATSPDPAMRNGKRALELALQADRNSDGESVEILDTLAAAYAETGDFDRAVETAQHALRAAESNAHPLKAQINARLNVYQSGKPFRDGL